MRRYSRDKRIRGARRQSAQTVAKLRRARDLGLIKLDKIILKENQRLDHIAFQYLGSGRLWWVIAALSDIGWGLQLPAGTIIYVPQDVGVIKQMVG